MRALVIGASGGIGAALCAALAGRGEVVGLSRSVNGLDLTDETSIAAHMAGLEGAFDRIFVATGALQITRPGQAAWRPEKTLRAVDPAALAAQFALNAIGPLLVLKHARHLMPRDADCRFAALSARVGSIGDNHLGGWYGYRAAKAALNQMLHTAAIELARSHPRAVIAALHPGTVATAFTADYQSGHATVAPAVAAAHLIAVLDGLTPAQSGGFYDWAGKAIPW
ncbi:SDR family NAD(P)-dependent oxidoreductase [Gemmobacter fulvus]|uniref:SDR family NAD(P)-dependent oxidoreductase n=1 Tax=Gemmobacter fulvus TaxID=2840474 RepID=A0A975P9U5_9RHOB|nr:SDR family NAD(P)-dependent oxidoreductase [Gemmobacter fulvus]MBT9244581.1 SDR family NAD(P)-dependent oxidoreductase [Gemmobacter fulvus]QWK91441.1 SDR family NAD(P)-dependent oxidoreductase [Gemmobacter fulvus]